MNRETIRAIFLEHRFTVKDGPAGLEPVCEAAETLVRATLANIGSAEAPGHVAMPTAVMELSELVKFTDQTPADPVEKARRYLKAMGGLHTNSIYQFDDGCPTKAVERDALATLAVLEQLVTALTTHEVPDSEAQREDLDVAFEAVRQRLCELPRYSFLTGPGGVSREQDRTGRWIDFQAAHELFDPVAVDAACATKKGKHA